jgi:hypothetical protein
MHRKPSMTASKPGGIRATERSAPVSAMWGRPQRSHGGLIGGTQTRAFLRYLSVDSRSRLLVERRR